MVADSNLNILAIDTAASVASAAVLSRANSRFALVDKVHVSNHGHAQYVLDLIRQLMQETGIVKHQLNAIAFGMGPGSFTGLRVACGVAQGLALSLAVPVLPVDSLLAASKRFADIHGNGIYVIIQDARMQEVYCAVYSFMDGQARVLEAPFLMAYNDLHDWLLYHSAQWNSCAGLHWYAHGSALASFTGLAEVLTELGAHMVSVDVPVAAAASNAHSIALLAEQDYLAGKLTDPAVALPAYVRNKVAYTTDERSAGLGGNPKAPALQQQIFTLEHADLPEVLAIERQVQDFAWSLQNFTDALVAGYQAWGVRRMGSLLGYVVLMPVPDMAHLLLIGVRPDAQRQGIGSVLLKQCINYTRQAGLAALTLEVRSSNQQAIDFYQANGFSQRGLRRDYYPSKNGREDALIMTRDIDNA